MKHNKWILWLLLLPVLLILIAYNFRQLKDAQEINVDVGGFADALTGEKVAMKRLAQIVQDGSNKGTIWVRWSFAKRTTSSEPSLTMYGVVFEASKNHLVKTDCCSIITGGQYQVIATQYVNVDERMLFSVASRDGVAADLLKHGAKQIRQGSVKMDAKGQLILQW